MLQAQFKAAAGAQASHLTATTKATFASLANLELLVVIAMKVGGWVGVSCSEVAKCVARGMAWHSTAMYARPISQSG